MVSAILFLSQEKKKGGECDGLKNYSMIPVMLSKKSSYTISTPYLSYGFYLFDKGALYTLNYMSLQNDCLQTILL